MSDDLVKRLRRDAEAARDYLGPPEIAPSIALDDAEDAADEIERLRAERDAAYQRGYEAAREQAALVCSAEGIGHRENDCVPQAQGAFMCAKAVRAMQPKEASDD